MIIGVPREVKVEETRVALTPAAVHVLSDDGHRILVERDAGRASGFTDAEYRDAGAETVSGTGDVWAARLVVKVKEPQMEEYSFLRPGLWLFTYLHLAGVPDLAEALLAAGVVAIGYETVQLPDRSLPLLVPMSEVAGRLAVQVGCHHLERRQGGCGVLLGGVPGVTPGCVAVVGGGTAGANAARVAAGMGARVMVLDASPQRLRWLDDQFRGDVETLMSTPLMVQEVVCAADLVVSAVLLPGSKAPRVVEERMVRGMKDGSVIVDIAIDQGGSVETCDHPTTHAQPTYVRHGVVHYAVSNMPAAVPRTSTLALVNATLPFCRSLAAAGDMAGLLENATLVSGINTCAGQVTHPAVAASLSRESVPVHQLI